MMMMGGWDLKVLRDVGKMCGEDSFIDLLLLFFFLLL